MSRLAEAIARIDAANASDPNRVDPGGGGIAKELLYGQRMTSVLSKLSPAAGDLLVLACRASHVRRWESARSDFPEGRAGYKQWRSQLLVHHAKVASSIMAEVGYAREDQERVAAIIQKQHRSRDEEVQTLEDVACLVFLEFDLSAFQQKHERDKLIGIVRKTWAKMSAQAHALALELELAPEAKQLVGAALAEEG